MRDRKIVQLLMIAACIVISIFGIYFQFFHKSGVKKETENKSEGEEGNESMMYNYDLSNKNLPDIKNETENETFTDGKQVYVYFTNADILDKSDLPLDAHKKLNESTQNFLKEVGYEEINEIAVIEESFNENKDNISFQCYLGEHKEKLRIQYIKSESKLKFSIVNDDGR